MRSGASLVLATILLNACSQDAGPPDATPRADVATDGAAGDAGPRADGPVRDRGNRVDGRVAVDGPRHDGARDARWADSRRDAAPPPSCFEHSCAGLHGCCNKLSGALRLTCLQIWNNGVSTGREWVCVRTLVDDFDRQGLCKACPGDAGLGTDHGASADKGPSADRGQVADASPRADGPSGCAGAWTGSWFSGAFKGSLSTTFTQVGASITGSAIFGGSPCFTTGSVSATATGASATGTINVPGGVISFSATCSSTTLSGSFSVSGGLCNGAIGTIALSR